MLTPQRFDIRHWQLGKFGLYIIASTGPFGSAAAQFILSLVLLRTISTAQFGAFSFLLIAAQLSWGAWSALFCAPLPVLLSRADGPGHAAQLATLFTANLAGAGLAFVAFVGIGIALGLSWLSAGLFAGFGAAALVRWFARAYAYATGTPLRTAASDLTYSGIILAGTPLIWRFGDSSLALAWGLSLVAVCAAFLPFGRTFLVGQFGRFDRTSLGGYGAVWREHSRWSLLGVVTTEATANAHVYIVTLLSGASAFAPLAASALLIRPITVAMNALTEFERARLARQIGTRDIGGAQGSVRFFRWALIATWIGTAVLTALLLGYAPGLVFPARYDRGFLAVGATLWMAVAAIRLLRVPESCLLQAAGEFRPLAFASVWSSGVSVVAVLLLLALSGPLWSILGILLGEAAFAAWIWREARRWLAAAHGPPPIDIDQFVASVALEPSPVPDAS